MWGTCGRSCCAALPCDAVAVTLFELALAVEPVGDCAVAAREFWLPMAAPPVQWSEQEGDEEEKKTDGCSRSLSPPPDVNLR